MERPSRNIRKSKREPGGVTVKPGNYRIVLGTASNTSETSLEVLTDPRLNVSKKTIEDRYRYSKVIEGYMGQTTLAVNQLKASKATLASYKKRINAKDKESNTSLIDKIDEASKAIDSILDSFLGKVDKRQGIVRNPENSVVKRIYTASGYIRSRPDGITETEKALMQHALNDLKIALEHTNSFYEENWDELKMTIEAIELSEFKEIKRFQIKN